MAEKKTSPAYIKFLFGGLSGMGATLVVQPLDLVKNRMQLSGSGSAVKEYRNSFHAATSIAKNEGISGLYKGLSAGLFRQATYTTTRLGIYNILFEYATGSDNQPPGFALKALIAMSAGGIGALVGTPAEIALIRMTSDGRLPVAERRNYTGVFNALGRISREEGIKTLWRGATPTVMRAVVLNAAQLASYSQAKEYLQKRSALKDGLPQHFVASMISGFISTVVSMPVDIAKTRIQNQKSGEYRNFLDVWVKVAKQEGVFSLWKGFTPYYMRLGPHTVLTFILLEQMNKLYARYS